MGKACTPDQRERVRQLLESGRDEDAIEKETGVSDRTIRRWKLELERTGRIGKVNRLGNDDVGSAGHSAADISATQPPESRTGRHRVLTSEVEAVSLDAAALEKESVV